MPYSLNLPELNDINVVIGSVNPVLTDPFEEAINNIQKYWDKVYRDGNDNPHPESEANTDNVEALVAEVQELRRLIKEGETGADGITHYASGRMARYVATTILLLKAAGLDIDHPIVDQASVEAFQRWQAIAEAGNLLEGAGQSFESLQAMIETEYVEKGNEIIYKDMAGLKDSLKLTQRSMEVLTKIQDLHNLVKPQTPNLEDIDLQTAGDLYGTLDDRLQYSGVEPDFSTHAMAEVYTSLTDQRKELTTIIKELAALRDDPTQSENPTPNSLEEKLTAILDKLPTSKGAEWDSKVPTTRGTLNYWLIDGMNDTTTSAEVRGKIHQGIAEAMTASSNLNDEQKAELKKVLFTFEEFYKSASAIMSRVTQLIEKMAQNISR